MLFKDFPNGCNALTSLRNEALERSSSASWATEWEEHAKPLVLEASVIVFAFFFFFNTVPPV